MGGVVGRPTSTVNVTTTIKWRSVWQIIGLKFKSIWYYQSPCFYCVCIMTVSTVKKVKTLENRRLEYVKLIYNDS